MERQLKVAFAYLQAAKPSGSPSVDDLLSIIHRDGGIIPFLSHLVQDFSFDDVIGSEVLGRAHVEFGIESFDPSHVTQPGFGNCSIFLTPTAGDQYGAAGRMEGAQHPHDVFVRGVTLHSSVKGWPVLGVAAYPVGPVFAVGQRAVDVEDDCGRSGHVVSVIRSVVS